MDNVKGVLLLLVLALSAAAFLLYVQVSAARSQLDDAALLSSAASQLLRVQDVPCRAAQDDMRALAGCIEPLLRAKDFKQHAFEQPDARKDTAGILVVKNINKRTYEGEQLTLLVNRNAVQQGCDIPGPVGPDVTCRFTLEQPCAQGDLVEVTYPASGQDTRVFLKTC